MKAFTPLESKPRPHMGFTYRKKKNRYLTGGLYPTMQLLCPRLSNIVV